MRDPAASPMPRLRPEIAVLTAEKAQGGGFNPSNVMASRLKFNSSPGATMAPYGPGVGLHPLPSPIPRAGMLPLNEWNPQYMNRKHEVGARTFTLASGRRLCYFDDGDERSPFTVLCIHNMGGGKEAFLQKKPLKDVRMVSVDRPGSGGSDDAYADCAEAVISIAATGADDEEDDELASLSIGARGRDVSADYDYAEAASDLLELIDGLKLSNVLVLGHSMGGGHALNLAAAAAARGTPLRGVGLLSGATDIWHASCSPEARLAMMPYLEATEPEAVAKLIAVTERYDWRDPAFDWSGEFIRRTAEPRNAKLWLGSKETFAAVLRDPFFLCGWIDTLAKANSQTAVLNYFSNLHAPMAFDIGSIRCPVYAYHTAEPRDVAASEQTRRAVPHAQLRRLKQHGLASILREVPEIVRELVDAARTLDAAAAYKAAEAARAEAALAALAAPEEE